MEDATTMGGVVTMNTACEMGSTVLGNMDAFRIIGPHYVNIAAKLTGSNCTALFRISRGARVAYSATSDATCHSGQAELVIDAAAAVTVASMRAASPKLLSNTYGTMIYET